MDAIETLNFWGASFVDFAVPMLVQSSLLILLLFALDLVLRNKVRAVVRYALWMLVLIKLVLPTSFAAPTSLAYWLPEKKLAQAQPANTPQFVVRHSDIQFDAPPIPPSPAPPRPRLQFAAWLLLSWLAIALGLLMLAARRSRLVSTFARRAVPAPISPGQLLDACRAQMKIRQPVRLKLSGHASSPAVYGLWRPVVLIPQPLADKLSAPQLRAVLLHELAHIKRGDILIHYTQTLLQIVYWWHPLLWLANVQIRRVREQAVDETVMIQMGAEAETYPATLLQVAKLAFKRPLLALGLIGIVESKSALAQRIHRMINRPVPKSARLGFTGLAALFLAGAAFLPMARGQRSTPQPPPVASASGQQPAVVGMDVKFIEIEESQLAALGLGEPTLTEFSGHRAWALSSEQLNGVLQRALEQTGADVLAANRVTTLSGRQSRIQIVDIAPVEGTEVRVGPTCDLTPYVTGDLIDLAVAASVTERRPVDPSAPFTTVADAFLTNDVGTARVIVGNGGGVVLENPEAKSHKGNRYLIIVSATLISADRAAESQTPNPADAPFSAIAKVMDAAKEAGIKSVSAFVPPQDSTAATLETAKQLFERGQLEAAEQKLRYLLKTDPENKAAKYYVHLIQESRTEAERRRAKFGLWYPTIPPRPAESPSNHPGSTVKESERNSASDSTIPPSASRRVQVPVLGNLPFLGPGRKVIQAKLNRIVLPETGFDNVRLLEAIQWLSKESTDRDPDGTGLNFLVNPNVIRAGPEAMIDPATGNWATLPQPEPLDMKTVRVRIIPPLKNLRLSDALEAIVKSADKPIRYSVEEYAVVFSQKLPEAKQLETRFFRIDPPTFIAQEALKNYGPLQQSLSFPELICSFLSAAGVDIKAPNTFYYKDRTGVLMVRATPEELERVQKAIDPFNVVPQNKSRATLRANTSTGDRTANADADKNSGDAAESAAWARTYVCGGFRLKLDADGTYLASLVEDGVRRTERGIWKKRGQEFVLERQAGDLEYAIRRLRVDDRQPTHLLWVPEVINPSGAIEYFSFKPEDKAPSTSDGKRLGFDWFLGNTLMSNGRTSSQGGIAASQEDKTKPVSSPTPLETRTFRVDPNRFLENLRKQMAGDVSTNVVESVRRFFEGAGVNVFPPNTIYYDDRTGLLMVRATAKELDIVQNALGLLNYSPRQVTIEAKFVEVGHEDARKLGLDSLFDNGPGIGRNRAPAKVPDSPKNTIAVLTAHQAKVVFKVVDQRDGVAILSAPKVTTLSGRQAQISITQTTEVSENQVPNGPVLEILPLVAEDGITLSVDASATITDILAERHVRTRKLQGKAAVYDGQTLVLGGTTATVIARESNGQSVTNAIPEDTGKRLFVFITPTIIDPAGNPIHAPGQEPFDTNVTPSQPRR